MNDIEDKNLTYKDMRRKRLKNHNNGNISARIIRMQSKNNYSKMINHSDKNESTK